MPKEPSILRLLIDLPAPIYDVLAASTIISWLVVRKYSFDQLRIVKATISALALQILMLAGISESECLALGDQGLPKYVNEFVVALGEYGATESADELCEFCLCIYADFWRAVVGLDFIVQSCLRPRVVQEWAWVHGLCKDARVTLVHLPSASPRQRRRLV